MRRMVETNVTTQEMMAEIQCMSPNGLLTVDDSCRVSFCAFSSSFSNLCRSICWSRSSVSKEYIPASCSIASMAWLKLSPE